MADHVIRLDKSKTYGENHGDMTTDDPLYKVTYWQGGVMGGHKINLPFDVHGELVPDDGKREPFKGRGTDRHGNVVEVTYNPLWDDKMRAYVAAKKNRAAQIAVQKSDPLYIEEDEGLQDGDSIDGSADDDVNFVSWLKGEARYQPHVIRAAAKKRFSKNYQKIVPDLVIDLVRDERIVSENELSPQFKTVLAQVDKSLAGAA